MKRILILIIICLFVPGFVYGATLVFKTGFEGDIDTDAPAGTKVQWTDCGAPYDCDNNDAHCDTGCTDSVTGDNVPADFPGEYRVNGTDIPYWNIIEDITEIDGGVTDVDAKNGTQSMGTWVDGDAHYNTRWQLNLNSTGDGETYDDFSTTCVRYWVKWVDIPAEAGKWFLFEEWYSSHCRQTIVYRNGVAQWRYMYNTTNCTAAKDPGGFGCVFEDDVTVPENEWFQIISYHEHGNTGRVILKIKRVGQAEQTVFDLTVDNNDASNGTGVWSPLKNYGHDGFWVYWDDLSIFSCASANDLPAWDTDAVVPVVTVTATDATATEESTTTGTWTIACSPNCDGETINYSFSGTATLNTDYNCDDEDGTITITGASDTIILTPVDDAEQDVGEFARLTVNSGEGYSVGSPSTADINIEDNDGAQDAGVAGITVDASGSGQITYDASGTGSCTR